MLATSRCVHVSASHVSLLKNVYLQAPANRLAGRRSLQAVAQEEAGLRGLPGGSLVAHTAAVTLDGRRFALLAIAAGEAFPAGRLAGAVLHW